MQKQSTPDYKKMMDKESDEVKRIRLGLKKMTIPPEKLESVMEKAEEMKRKYPHMKPARMQRKVADYFHLQLTD